MAAQLIDQSQRVFIIRRVAKHRAGLMQGLAGPVQGVQTQTGELHTQHCRRAPATLHQGSVQIGGQLRWILRFAAQREHRVAGVLAVWIHIPGPRPQLRGAIGVLQLAGRGSGSQGDGRQGGVGLEHLTGHQHLNPVEPLAEQVVLPGQVCGALDEVQRSVHIWRVVQQQRDGLGGPVWLTGEVFGQG